MSTHTNHSSRDAATASFEPFENYGLTGNLETCALVSRQGSIDWFPISHLKSGSIFTRLLDADSGGQFGIQPASAFDSTADYYRKMNVLDALTFSFIISV